MSKKTPGSFTRIMSDREFFIFPRRLRLRGLSVFWEDFIRQTLWDTSTSKFFFQVATTSTLPKRNHLKHGWKTTFLFGMARFQVLSQSFLAYIQDSSSYRLWFQRFLLFPLFVYHIFTHLHTCAKMMQSDAIFFQVIHTTHQAGFVLLDG